MEAPHRLNFVPVAISSGSTDGTDYDVIAPFPWVFDDSKSIDIPGIEWNPHNIDLWRHTITKWTGLVAICGRNRAENKVLLIRTSPSHPLRVFSSFEIDTDQKPEQLRAMTWSLSPTLSPLLVLAGIQGIIYIYDPLSKERVSVLRGHGGRITSVTAHPRKPHIICTTSRDHTMRLWDLHLPKPMKVVAADPEAARLGPPFGNPLTGGEEEGIGPGKCFAVSAGGVGDGHKATVLDASLHPFLNIVATSSVDHAVMLWMYEPPPSPTASVCTLAIIGRPVFCFKRFHMAQVIRVHWLSPSVLLSQTSQSFSAGHDNFPGKLVVWEWLHYEALKEAAENGVKYARDYLNSTDSSSYKILAEVHIRQPTAMPLSISGTMATLTTSSIIRVIDLSLLIARARPDPDVALLHRDLSLEHEEEWQEKLREIKRQQWESAGNLWFPGVVDAVEIVNQNLEKTYNAVLYHGILIRVGERERVQVWLPSEALSH